MKLYAINFKDSGEILTPESFTKYWPNYGSSGLHGWRIPKKIYVKLGQAKAGFAHIPDELKPMLEISEFAKAESLVDGAELMDKQKELKAKKKKLEDKALAKHQFELATKRLNDAKIALERLAS